MSLIYNIYGHPRQPGGKPRGLGQMSLPFLTMQAIYRENDKTYFDQWLGERFVNDLAPYLAGQQVGAPNPKFKLSDIDYIETVHEDVVPSSEFVSCIQTYIDFLNQHTTDKTEIDRAQQVKRLFEENFGSRPSQELPGPQLI